MMINETQSSTAKESPHPAAAARAAVRSIPPARNALGDWWDRWYTSALWLQLRLLPSACSPSEEAATVRGWPERMAAIGHGLMLAGATLLIFALRRDR